MRANRQIIAAVDSRDALEYRLRRHPGRNPHPRFLAFRTVAGARWTTGCGSYVLARTNRELEPIKPMKRCAVNETVSRDSRLPLSEASDGRTSLVCKYRGHTGMLEGDADYHPIKTLGSSFMSK